MSKFNLEVPFTAFKGKVCKHSKIIFKKVRQTNFTSQICNPRKCRLSLPTNYVFSTIAVFRTGAPPMAISAIPASLRKTSSRRC